MQVEGNTSLYYSFDATLSNSFYLMNTITLEVRRTIDICGFTPIYCVPLIYCTQADFTIRKADGSRLDRSTDLSVCNNLLHSCFKSCTLKLGDNKISQVDNNYAYRYELQS